MRCVRSDLLMDFTASMCDSGKGWFSMKASAESQQTDWTLTTDRALPHSNLWSRGKQISWSIHWQTQWNILGVHGDSLTSWAKDIDKILCLDFRISSVSSWRWIPWVSHCICGFRAYCLVFLKASPSQNERGMQSSSALNLLHEVWQNFIEVLCLDSVGAHQSHTKLRPSFLTWTACKRPEEVDQWASDGQGQD